MKTATVKKHFEVMKNYVSSMQMRVDDVNLSKARTLLMFLNERIAECDKEIAEEAAKETEETNK